MQNRKDPIPPSLKADSVDHDRPLSWTPRHVEEIDLPLGEYIEGDEPDESEHPEAVEERVYLSYTGFPDGTFEVGVTIERRGVVSTQAERGLGGAAEDIRQRRDLAYGKAHLALSVLL